MNVGRYISNPYDLGEVAKHRKECGEGKRKAVMQRATELALGFASARIDSLEKENEDLKKEIVKLEDKIDWLYEQQTGESA